MNSVYTIITDFVKMSMLAFVRMILVLFARMFISVFAIYLQVCLL